MIEFKPRKITYEPTRLTFSVVLSCMEETLKKRGADEAVEAAFLRLLLSLHAELKPAPMYAKEAE